MSLYLYLQHSRKSALEQGVEQLNVVANFKVLELESTFSKHRQNLNDLADVFTRQKRQFDTANAWLNIEPALYKPASVSYFVETSGKVFAQPEPWQFTMGQELDLENNLIYNLVRDNLDKTSTGSWTPVYYDDVLQQWLMTYAKPIFLDKEFVGVLGAGLGVDPIIERLKQTYAGYGVEFFIHDAAGNIVFHPDYGARLLRQVDVMNLTVSGNRLIRHSLNDYIEKDTVDGPVSDFIDWGKKVYAVSKSVQSNGWVIVTYRSEQAMLKPWYELVTDSLLLFAFFLIFLGFLSLIFTRLLFINKLRFSAYLLSKADVENFTPYDASQSQDEIDEFHRQINKTFHRVQLRLEDKANTIRELKEEVDANKALAQAVSYSDSAVILLELDYTISYVDTKSLTLLRTDRETLMGSRFFNYVHEHMAFISEQIVNEIRRKSSWHGELVLKELTGGTQVWINATITPMRDESSQVTKYVVSMQDISFIKDSQSKIEKLAYTDELTNLANRTFFMAQLEKLVEISKRGRYDFALLYFDIDDFKRVNDIYGHDGGDQLLMELAARLGQHLRNEDVLARMGGDEFALIVGGAKSEQDVLVIANAILSAVNEPFFIRGAEVQSGTSIGITMSNTDQKEPELLLQHADLAMYEAKSLGKNTYQFYTQELNEAAKERQEIESALRLAVINRKLELHYQPKVDFEAKKLIGFEALVRWTDEELGFVSPAKFIPIAEQSALILQLGAWVVREACLFAASNSVSLF